MATSPVKMVNVLDRAKCAMELSIVLTEVTNRGNSVQVRTGGHKVYVTLTNSRLEG